jgi:4-amino-4-deoxy-L-arabinose transferase-like glycosyltransferase
MNLKVINNFYHFIELKKNFLLKLLIIYSVICSVILGESWDINEHLLLGKSTFNYLFSFGIINDDSYVNLREFYSSSYWSVVYFITQLFPKNIELTIFNLINLLIGWFTLIGFYKFGKILFNKKIGVLFFITLFFHPIFFGHISINPKDTILAFCHIWVFYLIFLYLEKQSKNYNTTKIIWKIGILFAVGTGIQLYFLASLIPIFFFLFFEIFYYKKIIYKNFNIKKFFLDVFFIFLIFYIMLIVFWIDTHDNIIFKPFELFVESFNTSRGWPTNIYNGNLIFSIDAPKKYIFITTLFKSPEYILLLYIFFIIFFSQIHKFYNKKINNFFYKLFYILLILIYPNIIMIVNPFPVYDGIRLFMWFLPYTLVLPCLSFFYLMQNHKKIINITIFYITILFIIFYVFIFFIYTPYQYTYLNLFAGGPASKSYKFENDYWGLTLKELIKNIKKNFKIKNNEKINVYLCAIPEKIVFKEIKKANINFIQVEKLNNADYIILTNRSGIIEDKGKKKLIRCNDLIEKKLIIVKRFGHTLATFGEIKKITTD